MVEKQLLSGIGEGRYCILPSPTPYCSPVSVIPKETGGMGLIHDLSSPWGHV